MRGEGKGSTNHWNKARRTWALGALFTVGLAAPALAQPIVGDVLGESVPDQQWNKRYDCHGNFCVWQVTTFLGPCAGAFCENSNLYITDRGGRILVEGGEGLSVGRSTFDVRFIGPRRIEILKSTAGALSRGDMTLPEYIPPDTGVDQVARVVLQRWTLSANGKALTREKDPPLPAWKREKTPASAPPSGTLADTTPRLHEPVSEALLAQARKVCGAERMIPLHHECHGKTCVLVLDTAPGDRNSSCGRPFCPVLVKGDQVRALPLPALTDESPHYFSLTPTAYTFVACDGVRGSEGSHQSISRVRPESMDFVRTEGLHVEGATPYPVREAKSVEAARALAPTVHAYTRLHIPWGRDAWTDAHDLALAWRLSRVGDTLHLRAEVDDDVVVPFTTGTGLHSDHLELLLSPTASGTRKLGVLLAPEGRLLVRRWREQEGGKSKAVEVDLPEATGSWSQGAHGYALDLALPLSLVRGPVPSLFAPWLLLVSDADTAGKQETLMGHTGSLYFWSEYPPTLAEYQRAQARD
ncbi:hypothetical protein [Archangium primigenium]|uniref:hypothetical protein n=1 Tax=[Archangium] primigenium TaxID=2792470 RepID=UPI0019582331|nr:hypothetical protein [Archangium primigenium]MBM7116949.1 hypothetical protein [Archangium primigenium]